MTDHRITELIRIRISSPNSSPPLRRPPTVNHFTNTRMSMMLVKIEADAIVIARVHHLLCFKWRGSNGKWQHRMTTTTTKNYKSDGRQRYRDRTINSERQMWRKAWINSNSLNYVCIDINPLERWDDNDRILRGTVFGGKCVIFGGRMRIAEKKRILHKVREEENEAKRRFFLKIEKPKHKKKRSQGSA